MAFQFDEIKKQNWISVLFALEYITDVLAKFLNDEFIKLHAKILSDLNNYKKCTSSCSKTKTTNSWCRTCTNWRNAILNTHQEQFERICKKINWKNVDSLEWPSNYKEVAKCFNPDMSTTKEDDISVIIGRVINCREIRNLFHITLPSACPVDPMKIREIRNTVYHGRNELSSAEKLEYFNTLMAFLQTPCLWKYPDAQEAMKKIQIFKTNNYRDIIKENVIDEHELKRMEKRISQNWRRCYNISIASIILVFVLLVLPLILLVIQEVSNRLCVSVESFLFGSLPEKVDLPNKSGFYNNISTTTLLVLVVVLLVPLVIFSFKELKTTRYFVFLETFMEQMYMKAAWPWRGKDICSICLIRIVYLLNTCLLSPLCSGLHIMPSQETFNTACLYVYPLPSSVLNLPFLPGGVHRIRTLGMESGCILLTWLINFHFFMCINSNRGTVFVFSYSSLFEVYCGQTF